MAHDTGAVTPRDTLSVALTRGSHTRDSVVLGGPAGLYCLRQPASPYDTGLPVCDTPAAPVLRTYGRDTTDVEALPAVVAPELGQRGYRSFLVKGRGLELRRRQWVPPSGEFARTLTVLHNPGATPLSVSLTSLLPAGSVLTTSNGDSVLDLDDSFVVLAGSSNGTALIGVAVLGGVWPAASLQLDLVGGLEARHNLELAPGATRAFLTFTAWQAEDPWSGDLPILGLAHSLADLSHPEALTGLTQEERDLIINFAAPAAPTGLTGHVFAAPEAGAAAVAGAAVAALRFDPLAQTHTVVARGVTGADGTFTLLGLPAGEIGLVARDPQSGRAGRVTATVNVSEIGTQDLALAESGSVHVYDAVWGGTSAGQSVTVAAEGYGSLGRFTQVLDEQGQALFTGVPAGNLTVTWSNGSAGATVAGGQQVEVPIEIVPSVVEAPLDLTGTDGQPYILQGDGALSSTASGACEPLCVRASLVAQTPHAWWSNLSPVTARDVWTWGYWAQTNVAVWRRVFVPRGGRYARIIDFIWNYSWEPQTVRADLGFDLAALGAPWSVTADTSGDGLFGGDDDSVVLAAPGGQAASVGLVVSGPGAAVRPTEFAWVNDGAPAQAELAWPALEIPAGGSVALLAFVVRRAPGGEAEAAAQAESLRTLADPEALSGLLPEERAAIVNFAVPAALRSAASAGAAIAPATAADAGASRRAPRRPIGPPTRRAAAGTPAAPAPTAPAPTDPAAPAR